MKICNYGIIIMNYVSKKWMIFLLTEQKYKEKFMFELILNDDVKESQYEIDWVYQNISFYGNKVFCPMCEVLHENNSECQRNN